MRLIAPLALVCLLANTVQARTLLQGSSQFIQWGLALPGKCSSLPSNYNVQLNNALQQDVQIQLRLKYGQNCNAIIPTYPNNPDAKDSPLACADYKSVSSILSIAAMQSGST